MSIWSSAQYLKFGNERTQPSIDLAARVYVESPADILDIGCGPGNSTAILKSKYPGANVLGIDNSRDMTDKAKSLYDDIEFELCDAQSELARLDRRFDIVFSNACLQWIPRHEKLLPEMFGLVKPGGVMAVQIPKNGRSPLYRAMDAVVADSKWGFEGAEIDYNMTLSPEEYFDILSGLTYDFTMWETEYFHRMPTYESLVEWIKGTKLRPYLNALREDMRPRLESEIVDAIRPLYGVQKNGEIIYRFKRLFFIARKVG